MIEELTNNDQAESLANEQSTFAVAEQRIEKYLDTLPLSPEDVAAINTKLGSLGGDRFTWGIRSNGGTGNPTYQLVAAIDGGQEFVVPAVFDVQTARSILNPEADVGNILETQISQIASFSDEEIRH
ncbi:MAG: hypothetical protein COY80_00600 [Candidatus Pacebacteria bacterium CG_4_10_14_0_8_um_filter_42_14]|nr:MAG: hypothetical protein COY80_00600 [Candidatus Pacebacteria bacterium CG_4_10_14_0_8_um_filter_42_14]